MMSFLSPDYCYTCFLEISAEKKAFHLPTRKCMKDVGVLNWFFFFFWTKWTSCGRFLLSWEGVYTLLLGDRQLMLNKWAIVHKLYVLSEQANETQTFALSKEQKPLCLFPLKGDLRGRAEMLNTGIRIRNVTRKDSGTYRCEISAKSEEGQRLGEATITLTVLGTNFITWSSVKKLNDGKGCWR